MTIAALMIAIVLAGNSDAEAPAHLLEIPSVLVRVTEEVEVPAQEAGVLAEVLVGEGQMVQQDELLAQIVDSDARIALQRAKIEVEMANKAVQNDINLRFARKSVQVAGAELARSEESNQKYPKSISDSEMDRLRLVVQRSELEVEQAEYEYELAEFNRSIKENEYLAAEEKVRRRRITAPKSGVVVDVLRRRGEWVEPGETTVRLLRMDRLRVEGFVDAQHTWDNLEHAPVRLVVESNPGPAAEFPGEIVFVSPEIDPVNGQIRLWAEIENRGLRLRPGMRGKLIIRRPPSDLRSLTPPAGDQP